jgi:hypothetical protein
MKQDLFAEILVHKFIGLLLSVTAFGATAWRPQADIQILVGNTESPAGVTVAIQGDQIAK